MRNIRNRSSLSIGMDVKVVRAATKVRRKLLKKSEKLLGTKKSRYN